MGNYGIVEVTAYIHYMLRLTDRINQPVVQVERFSFVAEPDILWLVEIQLKIVVDFHEFPWHP